MNRKFGTKVAVLVGDFLFAQSSWFLAKLDNLEVGVECLQDCFIVVQCAVWTPISNANDVYAKSVL